MQENNTCYTYFSIKGDFEPDEITARLGLQPYKTWRIGDERPSLSFPKTKYTFASWCFGRCENYDIEVTNQMSETIRPLLDRVDLLNQIREDYDVTFALKVVPYIYGGNRESSPELMPTMARGCGYGNLTSWYNIDHATKSLILSDVSGNYSAVVGNNPNIYYGSNGLIYLCGTGSYSGKTCATDLQRGWYL